MFPNRGEIKETPYDEIRDPMVREDLRNLADKLRPLAEPRRITMKLAVFERRWLNMFIGKVDPNDQPRGFPVLKWIAEVTTNPYTWVDIIDRDGEVVYSVPPLLNSDAVKIQHVDFYHHVMELQAMRDHGEPKHVIQAYQEKHILNLIGRDENADLYMKEIHKIAMYHGYAPFTTITQKEEEVSTGGLSGGYGEKIRSEDF